MVSLPLGTDLTREAVVFGLVLLRCSGLVFFCPIFSSELVPVRGRLALAAALAFIVVPLVQGAPAGIVPQGAAALAVAAVRELAVGFLLGLAARALFDGIEGAARLAAGQSGFSLAAMVDPLTGNQSLAPALYQNLLALALFLAADLHHLFIRAVAGSYEAVSLSPSLPAFSELASQVGHLGARMFFITVQLAAPALLVTFAVDLVLVLVGRALPQIPVLMVGYPVKMAAGLVAMAVLTVATGSVIRWMGRAFVEDGGRLLSALSG